ncbi:MAG: HD-GYP domain-containing protein (c-di-GMP phosphodiesterase class II) [Desulforhopalus sp.]|jgi:HD-GYP domain-containing protein (c-di-GMP phosphodiesterase class II)
MNNNEIKKIDGVTEVIYRLLNGLPVKLIDMQNQEDDELGQLSDFVNKLVLDLQSVSSAISDSANGQFKTEITSKTPVAQAAKSLQATMRHLTWQTAQVAEGDFTQRVGFLGDFSSSFNWMVEQLDTNRSQMETKVKERTQELSLLLETTARTAETHDLDIILEEFSKVLLESFEFHTSCRVALFQSEKNSFQIHKNKSVRGVEVLDNVCSVHQLSEFPVLSKIIENSENKVIFREDPVVQGVEKQFLFKDNHKSVLVMAFYDGNAPLGFVLVNEDRDPSRSEYTDDSLRFYRTLTNHLSLSIKNALLFNRNRKNFIDTIEALAASIDARDAYTHFHSRNVTDYSVKIAKAMGFSDERIEQLSMACLLHDIGKIGVRDAVLLKPGKLSEEEFEEIKQHPVKAKKILSSVKELDHVAEIIIAHHERFDGKGYPYGLSGSEIPLEARIISIADSVDAMTTSRVYRPAMTKRSALKEVVRCSGTQFDPEIVPYLENLF